MVHILSGPRRDEFLAGDCIARFEMCITDGMGVPTLYIKSNIIDLYFVSKSSKIFVDLIFVDDSTLAYIVGVNEGEDRPFYLFSGVETLSEKQALLNVLLGQEFDVILFNDYAIEIARATGRYKGLLDIGTCLQDFVPKGPDYRAESLESISAAVFEYAERHTSMFLPNIELSQFDSKSTSKVISGLGNVMTIKGFDGATEVHEMLPQIVSDHTSLTYVHSPYVEISAGKTREFSDAVILGPHQILCIQAKSFDFQGSVPPTKRSNAEKRTRKNVEKAIAQTKGSSRMIREGKTLYSKDEVLEVPKDGLVIFCIFVPSLSLFAGEMEENLHELALTLDGHGHGLVVLDPMQFLRTVQASEHAAAANRCNPDEAFFDLLDKNGRKALQGTTHTRPTIYRW